MDFLFESTKDDLGRMSSRLKWICRVLETNFPNLPPLDDYEQDGSTSSEIANRIEIIAKYLEYALPIQKIPKATGKLREIQNHLLELMLVFEKFCKSIGVKFWLDYGTLIGALRHKGFIPWDDDIDVCMMSEDWEKIQRNQDKLASFGLKLHMPPFLCIPKIKWADEQVAKGKDPKAFVDIFAFYKMNPSIDFEAGKKMAYDAIDHHLNLSTKVSDSELKRMVAYCNEFNRKLAPSGGARATHLFRGLEFSLADRWDCLPIEYVFPLAYTSFEGHKFAIPHQAEVRLETFKYGKRWNNYPINAKFRPHHLSGLDDKHGNVKIQSFTEWIANKEGKE